jgi:hypothetical protein
LQYLAPSLLPAVFVVVQHKLQCERAALAQKRATAQQKVAVLQKLLSDVTAVQQHQAKHLPAKVSGARQAQEKVAYYQAHIAKAEEQLAKNGFRPEVGCCCCCCCVVVLVVVTVTCRR